MIAQRSSAIHRSGPRALLVLLCVLALCTIIACRGRSAGASGVHLEVTPAQLSATTAVPLVAALRDTSGAPIMEATVVARGDMTHAGMEPLLLSMEDRGNGQYDIDHVQFNMAGDWVVTVVATLPDGRRVEHSLPALRVP